MLVMVATGETSRGSLGFSDGRFWVAFLQLLGAPSTAELSLDALLSAAYRTWASGHLGGNQPRFGEPVAWSAVPGLVYQTRVSDWFTLGSRSPAAPQTPQA